MVNLKKEANENEQQFIWRLASAKDAGTLDMDWEQLASVFNKELRDEDNEYTSSAYRKPYQYGKLFYDNVFSRMINNQYSDDIAEQQRELERLKVKFRDERREWSKQNYIEARVESKLDLLEDNLKQIGRTNFNNTEVPKISGDTDLLIILSDLHIGQCFSSAWGEYNSDIAKDRLNQLLVEAIKIGERHNSEKVWVSIQGDLISGSIHKALAITNREDVIEQIKQASEMVASFCAELSKHFNRVMISNVVGNHSRIDKKEEALHSERLDDLIGWIVGNLLSHIENITMLPHRNIDNGISDLSIRGKTYINVHGDYDSFNKSGVSGLVMMLGYIPYAITFGHMHTCAVEEVSGVKLIRGGSLAGSGDSYTVEKRLYGKPSQMICVCSESGVEAYYPIELK